MKRLIDEEKLWKELKKTLGYKKGLMFYFPDIQKALIESTIKEIK